MVSWRPLPGVVRSQTPLTGSLVQLSCRRYQPRGVLRALPSRVGLGWAVAGGFVGERWALRCSGGVSEVCRWR